MNFILYLRSWDDWLDSGASGSGIPVGGASFAAQPGVAITVLGTSLSDLFGSPEIRKESLRNPEIKKGKSGEAEELFQLG